MEERREIEDLERELRDRTQEVKNKCTERH